MISPQLLVAYKNLFFFFTFVVLSSWILRMRCDASAKEKGKAAEIWINSYSLEDSRAELVIDIGEWVGTRRDGMGIFLWAHFPLNLLPFSHSKCTSHICARARLFSCVIKLAEYEMTPRCSTTSQSWNSTGPGRVSEWPCFWSFVQIKWTATGSDRILGGGRKERSRPSQNGKEVFLSN